MQNTAEEDDHFGGSLAAGDLDGDGRDDLVIGTRWEDELSTVDAGVVQVLYGSSVGLTGSGDQSWWNPDGPSESARYGAALATGDLDHDGFEGGDTARWSFSAP